MASAPEPEGGGGCFGGGRGGLFQCLGLGGGLRGGLASRVLPLGGGGDYEGASGLGDRSSASGDARILTVALAGGRGGFGGKPSKGVLGQLVTRLGASGVSRDAFFALLRIGDRDPLSDRFFASASGAGVAGSNVASRVPLRAFLARLAAVGAEHEAFRRHGDAWRGVWGAATPGEREARCRFAFQLFDLNGDSRVSAHEMATVLGDAMGYDETKTRRIMDLALGRDRSLATASGDALDLPAFRKLIIKAPNVMYKCFALHEILLDLTHGAASLLDALDGGVSDLNIAAREASETAATDVDGLIGRSEAPPLALPAVAWNADAGLGAQSQGTNALALLPAPPAPAPAPASVHPPQPTNYAAHAPNHELASAFDQKVMAPLRAAASGQQNYAAPDAAAPPPQRPATVGGDVLSRLREMRTAVDEGLITETDYVRIKENIVGEASSHTKKSPSPNRRETPREAARRELHGEGADHRVGGAARRIDMASAAMPPAVGGRLLGPMDAYPQPPMSAKAASHLLPPSDSFGVVHNHEHYAMDPVRASWPTNPSQPSASDPALQKFPPTKSHFDSSGDEAEPSLHDAPKNAWNSNVRSMPDSPAAVRIAEKWRTSLGRDREGGGNNAQTSAPAAASKRPAGGRGGADRRRAQRLLAEAYQSAVNGDLERLQKRLSSGEVHVADRCMISEQGADGKVAYVPAGGQTLLHAAASAGRREVCELLLHYGADRKTLDDEGRTADAVAMDAGYVALAQMLLPTPRPAPPAKVGAAVNSVPFGEPRAVPARVLSPDTPSPEPEKSMDPSRLQSETPVSLSSPGERPSEEVSPEPPGPTPGPTLDEESSLLSVPAQSPENKPLPDPFSSGPSTDQPDVPVANAHQPGPMTTRYMAMPTTRLEAAAARASLLDTKVAEQTREHDQAIARLEREVLEMQERAKPPKSAAPQPPATAPPPADPYANAMQPSNAYHHHQMQPQLPHPPATAAPPFPVAAQAHAMQAASQAADKQIQMQMRKAAEAAALAAEQEAQRFEEQMRQKREVRLRYFVLHTTF